MTKGTLPAFSEREGGPAAVAPARWVICERSGAWAVGLRREAAEAGSQDLRLYETRSLADAWAVLDQSPASFLVAELTDANGDSLAERVADMERRFPHARVTVVCERSLAQYEWLVREAGAVWFAVSPRDLKPIVALARRHLQRAPRPPRDLAQQVWSSLPWGPAPG
jgi:hypothetical protein